MTEQLTPGQEAAAFHGIALNQAHPVANRLQAAKQALAWYEAEVERLRVVVEAARTWKAHVSSIAFSGNLQGYEFTLYDAINDLDGDTS